MQQTLNQTSSRREFTVADEYQYDRRSPVRWIISHIMRYPLLSVIAIASNILSNASIAYGAVLIGQGFDLINQPGITSADLRSLALQVFIFFAGLGVFGVSGAFAYEFIAQWVERNTREEMFISLLGKSQTFHNRQRVGDIMARATNDVQQLNIMINPGIGLISDALFSIIVPIIAIGLLNVQLLLVPILFLIVFSFALRSYAIQLGPVSGQLREQFGVMNAGLAEAISGIEVVKAYGQEQSEQRRFLDNARRYRDLFVVQGRVQAQYLPVLLFGVALGLGFGHALLLFRAGVLTQGDVVAFMGLMFLLLFPTFISLFAFVLVQLGAASAERILSIINTETELDENAAGVSQPMHGELVFENVTFSYGDGSGAPVLRNISFRANAGETVAIVGQTGSGKSTLTRLVNRTYDTTEGRVLIDGMDVRDWSLQALRSQISTIEQDIFLFSRTIGENIAFGVPDTTQAQIEQAARDAQADTFIRSFPDGYDTMVGERGVTLSGGQRQRLAIARAFLTDPRILILDDSTSAIDSATEDEIQQAMRRILHGRTTLLITHRLSQIRWADRILVIQRGELVAQGTHDELMTSSADYRRIFARYE
ncbi:MAG: ABC transporter ATP-binding protein [Chloroflexaceae bacterium]|nr:ABC transporter ATP-binding protein [Chloroflexaceae bacterium]